MEAQFELTSRDRSRCLDLLRRSGDLWDATMTMFRASTASVDGIIPLACEDSWVLR